VLLDTLMLLLSDSGAGVAVAADAASGAA